jgi:hypothetical protein
LFGDVIPAPATTPTARSEQQELVDYLASVYGKLLESHDWMDRGLALVSLSRLPGDGATNTILNSLKTDATPAVRVVAWQCLLARAEFMDESQWKRWRDATGPLVESGAFRGQLRVGLLRMMAAGEPSSRAKRVWLAIFGQTSALDAQDVPVLDELGNCLAAWRSRDVLQFLFETLSSQHDAYRAEYVLHAAGVDAPWAGRRSDVGSQKMWKLAIEDYARWWQQHRGEWKETKKPPDQAWRTLKPQFVPGVDLEAPIDRYSEKWKKELEIGTPDVRGLEVVFVVDATGSMQWVLDYFKGDVARILRAASLVSQRPPRIGLTFYRDHGDAFVTRSLRLTEKLTDLQNALSLVDAHGGADPPEAVYEGLREALTKNEWDWEARTRRAVVLIGDAPPQPPTQSACEDVARQCADKGIALYVVKASEDELPELDAIATAARHEVVAIDAVRPWHWPYELPRMNGNRWYTKLARPATASGPDRKILGGLLGDAINPQFRDRVEPLVAVMLALTSEYAPERREMFGVASPPSGGGADPQAR